MMLRSEVAVPRWARVFAALVAGILISACSGSSSNSRSTSTTKRTTTTTAKASTTSTAAAPATDAVLAPPLLPLYPFQTEQEVQDWESSGRRQPDYRDPAVTALAFAHFLGYTEVDQIVTTHTDATGAHVAVGSFVPDTTTLTTAAVVHLVKYRAGTAAPWEVVGTDDTDFALTQPAYGATITSPLAVGGTITGVDESIKVHVQQLHANGYLGEVCCIPAGGTASPWAATVTFSPPNDPVLMVSASTGGHTRQVERFTVNAVRAPAR